jgi:4-hydroxybenzoate polyprenyltransferase
MLSEILQSMRPRQWVKNLLLFAGLLFSHNLFNVGATLRAVAAFAVFCLLSGVVYLINDVTDRAQDRLHPRKSLRPIASGRLSLRAATLAAIILGTFSLLVAFFLGWRIGAVAGGYLLLQLGYSFRLKRIVVIDVMTVAGGFALRAVAGTAVVGVSVSPWLFVCTILLALFLALAKRRHELLNPEVGVVHRSVLASYTPTLLDQMTAVATSATVVTYCLYTIAPETVMKFGSHYLILTVPLVLYGVYRYLYLVYRQDAGGEPERVFLADGPLLVDVVLYAVAVVAAVYIGR